MTAWVHRVRICGSQVLRQCRIAGDTVLHICRKQTNPLRVTLSKACFKISVQNMMDVFKKQDVLLPGTFCYEGRKVATLLPVLPPAVTRDYREELFPVTLTVLNLQSDSYI